MERSVEVCSFCGLESVDSSLKQCGACRLVKYCSTSCQKSDWKAHKVSCKRAVSEAAPAFDDSFHANVFKKAQSAVIVGLAGAAAKCNGYRGKVTEIDEANDRIRLVFSKSNVLSQVVSLFF